MKNWCYSKKLVAVSYLMTILLTLVYIAFIFLGADVTSFEVIVGLAWGETAAANAFYFWKAKNENRIKLTKQMVTDLAETYGIDAVVSLMEVVLKE